MRKVKKAVRKAAKTREKAATKKIARKTRQAGIVIPSTDEIQKFAPAPETLDFCQKGAMAEEFLSELARRTFFPLWSHLRPRRSNGRELCDLLVIYDQSAVVWQVKNLKADASSGLARKRETTGNIRQLTGAKKALLELARSDGALQIDDPEFGKAKIHPGNIEEIFLISALLGDEQIYSLGMEEDKHEDLLHVLDRKDVEILTGELNTASDFIEYFRKKEIWLRKRMNEGVARVIMPGEEDLLALYLLSGREFPSEQFDFLGVDKHWEEFTRSEKYRRLKEEDKESRLWDYLIEEAQEAALTARSKGDKAEKYEAIVREMARPNRRQRRVLSQAFSNALHDARAARSPMMISNKSDGIAVSYCFLLMDAKTPDEKEHRRAYLGNSTEIVRVRERYRDNPKVVGIAADIHGKPESTFTFTLLDKPHLTAEDISKARELEAQFESDPIRKQTRKIEDY